MRAFIGIASILVTLAYVAMGASMLDDVAHALEVAKVRLVYATDPTGLKVH